MTITMDVGPADLHLICALASELQQSFSSEMTFTETKTDTILLATKLDNISSPLSAAEKKKLY